MCCVVGTKQAACPVKRHRAPECPKAAQVVSSIWCKTNAKRPKGQVRRDLYIYIYCYIIIIIIYVILIYFVIEIGWLRQRGLMIPDTVGTSLSTVQRTSDGMVSTLPDSLLEHALTLKPKPFKNLGFSLIKNRLCARLGLTAAGRRSAQMHPVTRLESRNPDV